MEGLLSTRPTLSSFNGFPNTNITCCIWTFIRWIHLCIISTYCVCHDYFKATQMLTSQKIVLLCFPILWLYFKMVRKCLKKKICHANQYKKLYCILCIINNEYWTKNTRKVLVDITRSTITPVSQPRPVLAGASLSTGFFKVQPAVGQYSVLHCSAVQCTMCLDQLWHCTVSG